MNRSYLFILLAMILVSSASALTITSESPAAGVQTLNPVTLVAEVDEDSIVQFYKLDNIEQYPYRTTNERATTTGSDVGVLNERAAFDNDWNTGSRGYNQISSSGRVWSSEGNTAQSVTWQRTFLVDEIRSYDLEIKAAIGQVSYSSPWWGGSGYSVGTNALIQCYDGNTWNEMYSTNYQGNQAAYSELSEASSGLGRNTYKIPIPESCVRPNNREIQVRVTAKWIGISDGSVINSQVTPILHRMELDVPATSEDAKIGGEIPVSAGQTASYTYTSQEDYSWYATARLSSEATASATSAPRSVDIQHLPTATISAIGPFRDISSTLYDNNDVQANIRYEDIDGDSIEKVEYRWKSENGYDSYIQRDSTPESAYTLSSALTTADYPLTFEIRANDGTYWGPWATRTITPRGKPTSCEPNWYCSSYTACDSNEQKTCTEVKDSNECGTTYTGTISNFDKACTSTSPIGDGTDGTDGNTGDSGDSTGDSTGDSEEQEAGEIGSEDGGDYIGEEDNLVAPTPYETETGTPLQQPAWVQAEWYIDSELVLSFNVTTPEANFTLPANYTQPGDTVDFRYRYSDGTTVSPWKGSRTVIGQPCNPGWICLSYDVCEQPMTSAQCVQAFDRNSCGQEYTGNFDEFGSVACYLGGTDGTEPQPRDGIEAPPNRGGDTPEGETPTVPELEPDIDFIGLYESFNILLERIFAGEITREDIERAANYWKEVLLVITAFGLLIAAGVNRGKKKK